MPLQPGTWLAHYEILSHLGSGGMGDVYHARDNKLQREGALKVLPEHFSRDPERIARFRREAQLLAQLNHPNIAILYNFEETGETRFLVMELVLGETLRERIKRGPLPLDESLDICSQITEALEHAHEKPIIHRDLKPANVKVTPQGQVKVLDFGLAKAFGVDRAAIDPHDAPTGSLGGTLKGTILGTPAYMSPEQARGKETDKRTDIWALGCVLFELLTGKQAFQGEDIPEILASVMKAEPDWSELPETTPARVRDILRRCLQKDAKRRSRDAAEIRLQIEEAEAGPATALTATAPTMPLPAVAPPPPRPAWRRAVPWGLAVALSIVTALAVWNLRQPVSRPVERLVVPLTVEERLPNSGFPVLALSPDGAQLAYRTTRGIYVRAMDSFEARLLPGTEAAGDLFFSPDGRWLGFFAGVAGGMKKVSVSGGAVLTLTNTGVAPRGASWGPNDTIVFTPASNEGLSQVSAAGGEPQALTKLKEGEASHRWPQFLPDGKSVLFTVQTAGNPDDWQIAVQRLNTAEHQILIRGGTYARYVPTGHLVYYRAGTMMAVPFDPVRLEVMGAPAPVLEGVMAGTGGSGAAQFSFSRLGSLVYVPGGAPESRLVTLVWVDRKGTEEPIPAPPRPYFRPRLSPDGHRLAIEITGTKTDIWIYDLSRETLTPLTFEGDKIHAGWTPDGKRVVYSTATNLYWKPSDGSGAEELLGENQGGFSAPSVTPDGKLVAFHTVRPQTNRDIWALPLEGDPSSRDAGSGQSRKARALLQTPFNESAPMFSPDGRWLAYASDESGRAEIYVRSFPSLEGKWRISTEGGAGPYWNPNGRELLYRFGEKMMAVDVTAQPTFSPGRPKVLFDDHYEPDPAGYRPNYDVSRDGHRFLMLKPMQQQTAAATQIHVVLNWFEELRRRVPAAK